MPKSCFERGKTKLSAIIKALIDPVLVNTILFFFVFLPLLALSLIGLPFYLVSCKVIINSFTFCLRQHWLILLGNYRLKGVRGIIVDSMIIYALQALTISFLCIDLLFFPEIRGIEIKSPVFITGLPRSGTTFTHRLLTTPSPNQRRTNNMINDSPYVIHSLWQILCPSITLRFFMKYLVRAIDKCMVYYNQKGDSIYKENSKLNGAYDLSLDGEAAEEGLIAMHCCGGDMYSEFLPLGFWWDLLSQYIGIGSKNHWKNAHLCLLKQLLQRQLYYTGKADCKIVAKSPSLVWFLDDVISVFPDCKIVLMVRDPYPMICSNLSLLSETWKTIYGDAYMKCSHNNNNNNINMNDEGSEDVWSQAYQSLIWRRSEQSKRYLSVLLNKHPRNRNNICVIRYSDIENNLYRTYEKCIEHCGLLRPSKDTKQWIKKKEIAQKSRKRTHDIKHISDYNLDAMQVKQKFDFINKHFNFKTEWK